MVEQRASTNGKTCTCRLMTYTHCVPAGEILLCDGPCMRSFHANEDCNVLQIPPELFKVLQNSRDQFLCPMCFAGKHRCFMCGNLGPSQAREQTAQELFRQAHSTQASAKPQQLLIW